MADNAAFSINQFFGEHPIRIIGSPNEPFFYATDLATVLGIKSVHSSIKNFANEDIVTPEQRERYGIITYRTYKDTMRPDPSVILLTERGAHRLIFNSKSHVVKEFQNFIFDLIHNARLSERDQLRITHQNDMSALNAINTELNNKLKQYELMVPIVYIFKKRINGNPYHHMQKDEIDTYFREQDGEETYENGPIETLYKMTSRPTALDFSTFTVYAEIFGVTDHIFTGIDDAISIPVERGASVYCRYLTEEPELDYIEGIKVRYH